MVLAGLEFARAMAHGGRGAGIGPSRPKAPATEVSDSGKSFEPSRTGSLRSSCLISR
jgi:hypothetical protein